MAANENSVGPYLHGNRFVAFFNVGGMEYAGGTTTSTNALRHEVFHSWWGRGFKPASQSDAWRDEAWTKYNDYGASGSVPFDFTNSSVQLCSRNPWSRITPDISYLFGRRFFEGVGSMVGVANMNSLMSMFYNERNSRPTTTMDMEEFRLSRKTNLRPLIKTVIAKRVLKHHIAWQVNLAFCLFYLISSWIE